MSNSTTSLMQLTPAGKVQAEVPFNSSALFWTGVAFFALAAVAAAVSK